VDAREIQRILLDIAGPEAQEDAVNSAEQLRHEGELKGELRGRAEGELKGRAEGELKGRAEGELRGLRVAVATTLSARAIPLSDAGRDRVASCDDVATLTRWLSRAATATSEADVFATR
jgi:predicted transposase YdaD